MGDEKDNIVNDIILRINEISIHDMVIPGIGPTSGGIGHEDRVTS